ncbi:MAG: cytochrome d ubiquinol oxidase subunit II [Myxococcota bacterium]
MIPLFYGLIGLGLVAWALTAGADFGAGLWDMLAKGKFAAEERAAIAKAIAPIWEANHVWLIFIIVLTFTVFPRAFSLMGLYLHLPLTIALIGIVLRGAAFTFRAYGLEAPAGQARWGRLFAGSSVLTPLALGMSLGGLASGDRLGFFSGWNSPFAISVGLLAIALFALLAAVYLTVDSSGVMPEAFRRKAILAEAAAAPVAGLALWRASVDAPEFFRRLVEWPSGALLQLGAFLAAVTTFWALIRRRYPLARMAVILQVVVVILGFGAAMQGEFILGVVSLADAGTRPEVLGTVAWSVGLGALLLVPALAWLFRMRG